MRRYFLSCFSIVAGAILQPAWAEEANPAHALAQKFAVEPQAKPKPAPGKPSETYEKEMLDAARAEAEARRQSNVEAAPAAPVEAAPSQTNPPPASQPRPAQHTQIRIEAKITTPAPAPTPARDESAPRETVLVVLTKKPDAGALPATADPIICSEDICFVSAGSGSEAQVIARADALSTRNTITDGAGACKGKAQCAFRGVTLKPGAAFQIVDLGLLHHERHESIEAKVDATCAVTDGDLGCDNPLTAPDYRVWLMPEDVAKSAGPEKIDAALADELPEENVSRDGDK